MAPMRAAMAAASGSMPRAVSGLAGWSPAFSSFAFVPGQTALSSWPVPLLTCLTYLALVFGIKRIMRDRQPFDLKRVVTVYNFILSVASGVLFAVLVSELYATVQNSSFHDLYCDPNRKNTRGPLVALYFINYIFKYVELMDTMFLVLRKKATPFLHYYHHAITLMLCWTQLREQTCVQWIIIVINLAVHVLLYFYYGCYELKMDLWWKKYLTTLQIIQFMVGLFVSLGAMVMRLVWMATPPAWGWGAPCHGSWNGTYFGLFVIISYLVLFMRLYRAKYTPSTGASGKVKAVPSMAFKSGALAARAKATPASTYSPAARSQAPTTASVTAALGLATPEDAYADMRSRWLSDPMLVADEERRQRQAEQTGAQVSEAQLKVEVDKAEGAHKRRVFGDSSGRL